MKLSTRYTIAIFIRDYIEVPLSKCAAFEPYFGKVEIYKPKLYKLCLLLRNFQLYLRKSHRRYNKEGYTYRLNEYR